MLNFSIRNRPGPRGARVRRGFAPVVDPLEDKVVLQTLPSYPTSILLTLLQPDGTVVGASPWTSGPWSPASPRRRGS